jgi:DNA repair protein RadC
METLFAKLLAEAPYIAALLILTLINQKSVERIAKDFTETIKTRDNLFLDMMQKLSAKLDGIDLRHATHAQEMTEGVDQMRRTIAAQNKNRRIADEK